MACRGVFVMASGYTSQRKTIAGVAAQICLGLCLALLSHLTLIESSGIQERDAVGGVTQQPENQNSTQNVTSGEGSTTESNTGTIVAVSVIVVVFLIAVGLGVYFLRLKRHSRMMDKEKKMQIQMSSARNAGVYQDLTVSVPADEKPLASPEHERLKAAEDA